MRTIPWEYTFEIRTRLSEEKVLGRLRGHLQEDNARPIGKETTFCGEATGRGFDVKEAGAPVRGFLPLFHATFQGDENVLIRVRATNGVSLFAVVFAWSAALVMFYQTFFSIFAEGKTITDGAPFLFQGLLYLGLSVLISFFYWRNVKRGETALRRIFKER